MIVDSIQRLEYSICAVTAIDGSLGTALQIRTYFAFLESAPLACLYYSLSDLEDVQRTLGRIMRLWRKRHINNEKVGRWMRQRSKRMYLRLGHQDFIICNGVFKSALKPS